MSEKILAKQNLLEHDMWSFQVLADFRLLMDTSTSLPDTAVGAVAHETALKMSRVFRWDGVGTHAYRRQR